MESSSDPKIERPGPPTGKYSTSTVFATCAAWMRVLSGGSGAHPLGRISETPLESISF